MIPSKMKVIGLTGSMGSGKSSVSKILADEGIGVVDADEIARHIVAKGTITLELIVRTFGQTVVDERGELKRKALADIVFSDKEKLRQLEAITHPAILSEIIRDMVRFRAEGNAIVVLDIPLLFENDYDVLCDETWVVAVEKDTQIRRLKARDGLSETDIKARLATQMPQSEKIARADRVIDNNGDLVRLKDTVLGFLNK